MKANKMKQNGFTLIELLVVIAIIALLMSILMPALGVAKELATGAVCLHNLRSLSLSYFLYAQDNDDKLVIASQGQGRWVERPQDDSGTITNHDSTVAEKENGIMKGTLFPYAETVKLYHCPGDKRYLVNVRTRGKGPYRSYALPVGANGPNTDGWSDSGKTIGSHTLYPVRKYTDIASPSTKYTFVEENYTHVGSGADTSLPPDAGYNSNVWSFWRGDTYTSWWDPLAPWHNNKTNLGYADGHADKMKWKDQRTIDFAYDRMSVPFDQPNNPDQEYMSRAYPCKR